jgi:hypothetical protein
MVLVFAFRKIRTNIKNHQINIINNTIMGSDSIFVIFILIEDLGVRIDFFLARKLLSDGADLGGIGISIAANIDRIESIKSRIWRS